MFTDRGPGQDLLASTGREPADLVVIDCMLLGALAAADHAGLRRAVPVHTFYQYLAAKWSRRPAGILGLLKGQHPVRLWSTACLLLVATLADLDPAARRGLPEQFRYTGTCAWSTSPPACGRSVMMIQHRCDEPQNPPATEF